MFKLDAKDISSLVDELTDEIDEDIASSAEVAARYAVSGSPVWTGLFKGNWNVSINEEYDGSTIFEDPSGKSVTYDLIKDIDKFTLKTDNIIYIQNNVVNPDTNTEYAQFVTFDFSGDTAERLISKAATTAAERLN